jgi:hypothetical protein
MEQNKPIPKLGGALWQKESFSGMPFMSGKMELANYEFTDKVHGKVYLNGSIDLVCFQNKHKKTANHPDWKILESQKKDALKFNEPAPHPAMTTLKPEVKQPAKPTQSSLDFDDPDFIPF